MDTTLLLIIIGAAVVLIGGMVFIYAKNYHNVGPNEVLIIAGGGKHWVTQADGTRVQVGYRMQIGGGTFLNPFTENAQTLPLETYTINIKTPEVLTREGVHIIAEASAQVKVASNEDAIRKAAEQFLGRGASAIKEVTENIIEGYVRSALGALSVEEVYQKRDEFNKKVRNSAVADLERMGLELLAFNLRDISDTQGYLKALGQPRIAEVKRDAAIAQAETDKETVIKTAIAQKEGDIVRFQVEAELASASRDFELQRAGFQAEINKQKAEADMMYEIERNRLATELKKAEYETRIVEKTSAIKVEKLEIERRELELESSVKKPAAARKYQIEAEAEADKVRVVLEAEGKAEAHKLEGAAGVEVKRAEGISRIEYTRNLGKAEADAMTAKAEAYKGYNEAATAQMFLEKLPELARAVAEPLSKVDKIIMVGNGADGASKLTGQVASVLAQMPDVVEAISGIDLKKMLGGKKE